MTDASAEDLLRELSPQVLGAVVRRYGHFDFAEDAETVRGEEVELRHLGSGIGDREAEVARGRVGGGHDTAGVGRLHAECAGITRG